MTIPSYFRSFGPLNLENFLLGMNIGERIFVNVVIFTHFFSLLSLILLIILIYKRILQISNGYTISPEEPLLKLLYHGGLEGSDILVQLNYLISEEFNLLEIQFVISFVDFLLLNELELFLIDDILCKLLLGFVVLFLM